MLDAETQCFRVKMSLQALLSKVCILMTSQKKTRREKRVCKKRKQFVIGSRIRERDKNNAEYYVGDYYPPIYWVPLVVCHSVCLWPINPHLSQQPAMGLGHKIFLGPFGAKKLKNDPY